MPSGIRSAGRTFMNNSPSTPQSGLTMIELAIVLAIIGLIASTLIPTLKSTVKRGKMTEARSVLYAVRDEIIGCAEANVEKNSGKRILPEKIEEIGSPNDPWGGPIAYRLAPSLTGEDVCREDTAANMNVVSPHGDLIRGAAFAISSNGPDHKLGLSDMISENGTVDANSDADDLFLFSTLFEIQAVLCDEFSESGEDISYDDIVDNLNVIATDSAEKQGAYVQNSDEGEKNLVLGVPDGQSSGGMTYGCSWYTGSKSSCVEGNCTFGKGFRSFFSFVVQRINNGGGTLGDGFTFSVISAAENSAGVCGGTGSTLGYSSCSSYNKKNPESSTDAGSPPFIEPPKIAMELDFYPGAYGLGYNDPQGDHAGVVLWGTNDGKDAYERGKDDSIHDFEPKKSKPQDPTVPPGKLMGDTNWFDDNLSREIVVRLDIERSTLEEPNGSGNYTVKMLFDCRGDLCTDLTKGIENGEDNEYNATNYIHENIVFDKEWHEKMDYVRFGWTQGTGNYGQNVKITNASVVFQ